MNSAGFPGEECDLIHVSPEEWRRILGVNLDGVFNCCQSVVPLMLEGGYGRVANIASMAGKSGRPGAAAYSAAKAGVIALTKSLGKELATTGVLVNAVAPAVTDTPMARATPSEQLARMTAGIPMRRMGRAEELAALVAWMCSRECSYSTGATFDFSGGLATY